MRSSLARLVRSARCSGPIFAASELKRGQEILGEPAPAGFLLEREERPVKEVVRSVGIRELFNLSGRVAIVTGGSVGLGRQMAEGLAEMGQIWFSARVRKSAACRRLQNCKGSECKFSHSGVT